MPSFQYKTYLAKPHRKAAISVTPQMLALFMSPIVAVLTLPKRNTSASQELGPLVIIIIAAIADEEQVKAETLCAPQLFKLFSWILKKTVV